MLTKRRVFDREAGLGTQERPNEVRQDGKTATHGLQRSENSRASWAARKRVKCFLDLLLANHRGTGPATDQCYQPGVDWIHAQVLAKGTPLKPTIGDYFQTALGLD